MAYETDSWPFTQARWFGPKRDKPPRLIVIHTMEFHEQDDAAEVIAHDFATRPETDQASSHICCDDNSIIQCVKDSYVAYAAPGANHDGMQIELAGFKATSQAGWRTPRANAVLANGADAAAQYSLKYDIPLIHISNQALRDGARGVVGHDQVTAVYRGSDHTDPGPNFPWARFISWAKASWLERSLA
jgi:N-acetyl-anhydromuramyl-L-alanine amidase AmpD